MFKYWRTLAGMTISGLSDASGVKISVIRRLETGPNDNVDGVVLYALYEVLSASMKAHDTMPPGTEYFFTAVMLNQRLGED
jgi:transcriptional regulator with XRE-family HTH domain